MRFALMIEPQQGLTYDEQLAIVRRAEDVGFESFFRSDHYQSFPGPAGSPTTDAWAVLAGLARETTTDRARHARLAGHVPADRQPREGRDDGRRDERRPGRVRPRRRLERRRARASWACRSRRSRSGPTCSRSSSPSSTGCGASPTAGRSRASTSRIQDAQFHPKPVAGPGRPTSAERRVAAAAPRRRRGIAAVDADRRPLRRRVQPLVVVAGRSPATKFAAARRGLRGDRPRPGDDGPLGDGRAC